MAFEAYLHQDRFRPRRGRRMTYTLSAVAHGLVVLGAVAYSFWHVEELKPPSVTVTFISAAAPPPPPPPPPPLGGGTSAPKHRPVTRPRIEVTSKTEIVQPVVEPVKEPPKEAPTEVAKRDEPPPTDVGTASGTAGGVKGGVAGGVKGGVVGGTVGGTGTAPAAVPAKFLPPQMGQQQRISGASPDFPTHLSTPGAIFTLRAKICVGVSGAVESVTLIKRAHPELDANVLSALKGWRYRPLMANNVPVPFCYFVVHEFKSE